MNKSRISEADILLPTLSLLAREPTGVLKTSCLIEKLTNLLMPDGEDAEILEGRNDTRFSQIVRNMVSHKENPGNIVADGYVEYLGKSEGLKITQKGMDFVVSRTS